MRDLVETLLIRNRALAGFSEVIVYRGLTSAIRQAGVVLFVLRRIPLGWNAVGREPALITRLAGPHRNLEARIGREEPEDVALLLSRHVVVDFKDLEELRSAGNDLLIRIDDIVFIAKRVVVQPIVDAVLVNDQEDCSWWREGVREDDDLLQVVVDERPRGPGGDVELVKQGARVIRQASNEVLVDVDRDRGVNARIGLYNVDDIDRRGYKVRVVKRRGMAHPGVHLTRGYRNRDVVDPINCAVDGHVKIERTGNVRNLAQPHPAVTIVRVRLRETVGARKGITRDRVKRRAWRRQLPHAS